MQHPLFSSEPYVLYEIETFNSWLFTLPSRNNEHKLNQKSFTKLSRLLGQIFFHLFPGYDLHVSCPTLLIFPDLHGLKMWNFDFTKIFLLVSKFMQI